jgi:hypothetical protein
MFQPLTLLDCLHTFCGACLKEWFVHQASSAKSLHPYTCPSCRASVRATKPSATVTTLLDMFLQANPTKARTAEDKLEQMERYKPGDNVLPKLRLRRAPGDEDDQRVLDEVTALSLREAGISGNNTLQEPGDRRRRENGRSRDSSRSTGRNRNELSLPSSRRSGQRSSREASREASREPSREPSPRTPARHIEHQSSLRSLMSASELDPQQMRDELLRQIAEEGLLDGIDLDNMDATQEEELSERIAQEYHSRREARLRDESRQRDNSANPSRSSTQVSRGDSNTRRAERPLAAEATTSTAPPVSNPHLISSANQAQQPRQRRSGSQSSTRSASRVDAAIGAVGPARSLSDVFGNSGNGDAARSASQRTRRMSHERRNTDPDRARANAHRPNATSSDSAPDAVHQTESTGGRRSHSRQRADSNPRPQRSPRIGAVTSATFPVDSHTRPTNNSSPSLTAPQTSGLAISNANTNDARPVSSSSASNRRPTLFTEPSISCDRCKKEHIEYELHYNCQKCNSGTYNICLSCYRNAKGCLHWYGFGRVAWQRYRSQEPPEGYAMDYETPHILSGHRYRRPIHPIVPSPRPDQPNRLVTEEDPAKRLENGVFCDTCSAFSNACYWKCDTCNDGDWGFCNNCVNQGRHCTHPLLPLKSKSSTSQEDSPQPGSDHLHPTSHSSPSQQQLSPPLTPNSASIVLGPGHQTLANQPFQPLTFTTRCDICTRAITPTYSRYHCPKCNEGDYDICSKCYLTLVSTGRISIDNGHQGWRRCLKGHRMCIVGFEDRDGGQKRIVVNDLVGGWGLHEEDPANPPSSPKSPTGESMATPTPPNWSWKDADGTVRKATVRNANFLYQHGTNSYTPTAARFPPDGGVGLRVYAAWAYFPAKGVADEIGFPKGAEIREVQDINGDWFSGVYAGSIGLFPGNYVVVVGATGGLGR